MKRTLTMIVALWGCLLPAAAWADAAPAICTKKIYWDRQLRHMEGTDAYLHGRSVLLTAYPGLLLKQYAGKGRPLNNVALCAPGSIELVGASQVIGNYIKRDEKTGKFSDPVPTRWMKIHYSKRGAHIVPAPPNQPPVPKRKPVHAS